MPPTGRAELECNPWMWPESLCTSNLCSTDFRFPVLRSLPALGHPPMPGNPDLKHSLSGSRAFYILFLLRSGQRLRELPLICKGATGVDFCRTSIEWIVSPTCIPVFIREDDCFRAIGAFLHCDHLECSFYCLMLMFLLFWVDILFFFLAYFPTFFLVLVQFTTKYRHF